MKLAEQLEQKMCETVKTDPHLNTSGIIMKVYSLDRWEKPGGLWSQFHSLGQNVVCLGLKINGRQNIMKCHNSLYNVKLNTESSPIKKALTKRSGQFLLEAKLKSQCVVLIPFAGLQSHICKKKNFFIWAAYISNTYCVHDNVLHSQQSRAWVGWRGLLQWKPSLNTLPQSTAENTQIHRLWALISKGYQSKIEHINKVW